MQDVDPGDFTEEQISLFQELPRLYDLDGEPTGMARTDVPEKFTIGLHIGQQRYFLKHIPDSTGPVTDHERLQLDVQQHLLDNDFPVAAIIETGSGQPMVEWRGQKYILYEFVGEHYDPNQRRQQTASMAVALGRFHGLTAESGLTGWWWDYDPTFRFPVDFLHFRRRSLAEADMPDTRRAKVEACLNDMGEMLSDAIEQLFDGGWCELPEIPIHGDFGTHNCRFSGSDVAAVVDFGMTRMSPRSLDISKGLATSLGPGADGRYPGWEQVALEMPEREAIAEWLANYMRFAPPFDEKEARLLPLVCAANWTTWGHPEQRVESAGLVTDYMRCLLHDSWNIYSIVGQQE